VFAIRLIQWIGWVFETKESKKELARIPNQTKKIGSKEKQKLKHFVNKSTQR
jgi:hypothetical protein